MKLTKYLAPLLLAACALAGQAVARQAPLKSVLAGWDRDPHPDLRSVLVMRDGAIIAERYYNGETADTLHDVRSAGKSITALLAGAAVDRRKIVTGAPLERSWPAVNGTALAGVTLDDILTMRSGLAAFDEDPDSPGNEDKMDQAADPLAFTLATPRDSAPGGQYRYNSMTAYIAGVSVEQASGMDLEEFARTTLFGPLGIERWQWLRDAAGHPKGQGNLSLRTRDLARIGQMVLDKGMHRGRRVISAKWIDAMLTPRVDIAAADPYADGYGYFWYAKTQVIGARRLPVFFASGNGGNKIYVIPSLRSVVVVTSSAYGKGYGQRRAEDILKAVLAHGIQ